MLTFLLCCTSFIACLQAPNDVHSTGANLALGTVSNGQTNSTTVLPLASNIIFQSKDGGDTWQDVSAGLPENLLVGRVLVDRDKLYLAAEHELFHSEINTSAPFWMGSPRLGVSITNLFAGQHGPYLNSYENGFYKAIPGTEVLIPLHHALEDKTVRVGLETPDGTLFIGCESGLFKTADSGTSWKQIMAGTGVNSLTMANGVLLCGTHDGILRSTDAGENWEKVLTKGGPAFGTGYAKGRFYTITQGNKNWNEGGVNQLHFSTDDGKTWQRMGENLASAQLLFRNEMSSKPIRNIFDLKYAGKYLFCSCDAGVYRSSDWGKSWEPVFQNDGQNNIQLAVYGDVVFAVQVIGC